MSASELITIGQAASLLHIGRSRCYSMAADGTLAGVVRLGKSIRVSRDHLEAWIASSVTDTQSRGSAPTPTDRRP